MEEPAVVNSSNETFESIFGPRRDVVQIVIPVTVIYVIIFVTGVVGNISTCVVIARNKSMHTATNYYLFSLAISDLLLLVTGLPQEMHSIWMRYPYILGQTFCVLRGLFSETAANATVLTITAFTVERYVAICHPFLSHTMSKLSRAVKLILVVWLIALACAIPQALQLEVFKVWSDEPDSLVCQPANVLIEHAFTISTVLFFILPMTVITVLYALIGLRLRSSTLVKNCSSASHRGGLGGKRNGPCRYHGQSSRRVVKMLVAVVVAFFLCWAPFHAQRLYATYTSFEPTTHRKIYDIMTYLSGILYYLSATVNPVLYNIMSNKFREAFKETFTRCCRLAQLKPGRPQRSYSVLSRSVQRGADSTTDSGRDEPSIHTTITHKSSLDSFNGQRCNGRRILDRCPTKELDHHCLNSLNSNWHNKDPCDRPQVPPPPPLPRQPPEEPRNVTVHLRSSEPGFRFWRLFRCADKKDPYANRCRHLAREPSIILLELERANKADSLSISLCEISNSSLKDVEHNALEDELTTYMKEIKRRERCN